MAVGYTVFVDKAVWSQHGDDVNLCSLVNRLPEDWIIYDSNSGALSPWFNSGELSLLDEDIDPVLKMLVLVLNL